MLSRVMDNTSCCNLDNRDMLREVTVKIGLERIDIQEGVMVEALLDSGVARLIMSSEFVRKQGFKLKKIERSIYVRNMDSSFNKEGPIKYIVKVNIYYQRYRERIEINIIGGQKWSMILGMLWLTCHNSEINWRIGEVKMTRCLEKYSEKWRLKQENSGWQKQKKEERKRKRKRNEKRKSRRKRRKKKRREQWK